MKKIILLVVGLAISLSNQAAVAHFVELTTDKNVAGGADGKDISLEMTFTHPFENGPLMIMERPESFGVLHKGKKTDLLSKLNQISGLENLKWSLDHQLNRLGDYTFFVEPVPYFEPAENKFIIHYTKTVVTNGGGDAWDELVGFPVEIQPLSRPYGLWTNNSFRGIVLQDDKPVPFAEIEVEYKNEDGIAAPNDSFITQVIKADANGVFSYNMPKAGWWGFAALIEDGETKTGENGNDYIIEKGALIWVKTEDMK